jgi:hypothetical protein
MRVFSPGKVLFVFKIQEHKKKKTGVKGRAKIAMGISSMKAAITLMINRPEQGLEIVSMSKDNWVAQLLS